MRLVNKDLTQAKVWVNVSEGEIYIEIFSKVHGKWKVESYFKKYDFIVDRELMESTVKYIINLWGLNNPKVFLAFGN